jgi:hypothetical protein
MGNSMSSAPTGESKDNNGDTGMFFPYYDRERAILKKNLEKLSIRVRVIENRRKQQNKEEIYEILNNIARCST